jgi:hypothetical protein
VDAADDGAGSDDDAGGGSGSESLPQRLRLLRILALLEGCLSGANASECGSGGIHGR